MTSDTLYVLVSCCLEQSRFDVLERVVANIKEQRCFDDINRNMVVFDNGSVPGTSELLVSTFKNVVCADRNVGYWTALRWIGKNYQKFLGEREFVYSIESDCIHDRIERLEECETFLKNNPEFGMVRTQEFQVSNRELYDKGNHVPGSKVYAWQRQYNQFRNERVTFEHVSGNMFATNMTPVVCGLNRLSVFVEALETMARKREISEADFQKFVDDKHEKMALFDGGLFHSKLSFESGVVAGSRIGTHVPGYRFTQRDKIDADDTWSIKQ